MSNQWFRSWHGAPTDPKWLGIARKAGVAPGIVAAVVWALLDRASQADDRGSIAGYDADGLSCFMGCEADQVESIIGIMHEKGILIDGSFSGWEEYQPKREDDSKQRVKEYRERLKTHRNADVTQCNATKQPETLDTDTDTDTDTDAEREKDARAQEFPHSQEVGTYLEKRAADLDPWENDFLISIRWKNTLTKPQRESLEAIRAKLGARVAEAPTLPSVKRGTPAYDAWITHYRKKGRATFFEKLEVITVPTEFPPGQGIEA